MSPVLISLLGQPLLWAALGVVFGPYLFFRGFRLLQRKRLIMDIPRSTVRASALGCVEVSGRAVGPYKLVAALSKADCLYYRIAIESNPEGDLRRRTHEMCAPLFLDDGTGTLMITQKDRNSNCSQLAIDQSTGNSLSRQLVIRRELRNSPRSIA
jgi:hypothetical protein